MKAVELTLLASSGSTYVLQCLVTFSNTYTLRYDNMGVIRAVYKQLILRILLFLVLFLQLPYFSQR